MHCSHYKIISNVRARFASWIIDPMSVQNYFWQTLAVSFRIKWFRMKTNIETERITHVEDKHVQCIHISHM